MQATKINTAECSYQKLAQEPEAGVTPYMRSRWERIHRFLLSRNVQTQTARQNEQNDSLQSDSVGSGDYQPQSACQKTFDPQQIESQMDDHSRQPSPTVVDVMESSKGTSIIGIRSINGTSRFIWGKDNRNLPWA